MKRKFAFALFIIDIVLVAVGLTCLVMGCVFYQAAQSYQVPFVNTLFGIGFFGLGSATSTSVCCIAFNLNN